MLPRLLLSLLIALAFGGAAAASASASTAVIVTPSLTGAGRVSTPAAYDRTSSRSCSIAAPVREDWENACFEWTTGAASGSVQVDITATAVDTWKFDGWTGCPKVINDTICRVEASDGETARATPRARFVDRSTPELTNLRWEASPTKEGTVTVVWDSSEPGPDLRCLLDGAELVSSYPCISSPLDVQLAEGRHILSLQPTDRAGNAGKAADVALTVVDTELSAAAGAFTARTKAGDAFECSVDGGTFTTCGRPGADGSGPLTLPAQADGTHQLEVRARAGADVDLFPASTTWTVDTTAAGHADPTPAKQSSLTPEPAAEPARAADAASPAALAGTVAAAPQRLAFTLRYTLRGRRFTQLAVTGLAPRANLRVSVKCPRDRRCPAGFLRLNVAGTVNLARLVGRPLPAGTKLTVRARRGALTVTRTITIPRSK